MMQEIFYIDRKTGQKKKEKIYGHFFLHRFYGEGFFWRLLCSVIARIPFFSHLYGAIQKSQLSRFKISRFIEEYGIDASEFLEPVSHFASFNDFFIRRLKPTARSIVEGDEVAILPADARYLVFPDISKIDGFWVKGKKFCLERLLGDKALAERYREGALVIARLCPVDYHRFHFPCACLAQPAQLIPGPLFSVNPIALKKNINYLCENKRMVTELKSALFGTLLFVEVGATHVGSIHQTYRSGEMQAKGEEKGYFSFGGSCILLLFEKERIAFDADLLAASEQKIEVLGLLGQSLGRTRQMGQRAL